jgi:hypothetical protein
MDEKAIVRRTQESKRVVVLQIAAGCLPSQSKNVAPAIDFA